MDLNLIRESITNSTPIYSAIAWLFPAIMAGASALGSILGGKNKQTQNQTSTYSNTTTPEYDPQALSARNTILDKYLSRINGSQGYMTGYTGQGMRKINQGADIKSQALNSILAARGLSSSPVGAALAAKGEDDRMKQLTDFYSSIPLLQRQMEGEDLGQFGQFVSSIPVGQTQTGTSTGANTNQGSTAGALGNGLTNGISAYLLAKYYNGQNTLPYSNTYPGMPGGVA